jgi:cytoskeletal protein RodZ
MSFKGRRPRTSTLVLSGLFLAVLALWLWVRPPVADTASASPATTPAVTHPPTHTASPTPTHRRTDHSPTPSATSPSPSPTTSGPSPSLSGAASPTPGEPSATPSATRTQP